MFHRIEEMTQMPGPRFFRLAVRLGAYQGALAARFAAESEADPVATAADRLPSAPAAVPSATPGARDVVAVPAALAMSDIGDMFSFGAG